jgi:hypothetical protein
MSQPPDGPWTPPPPGYRQPPPPAGPPLADEPAHGAGPPPRNNTVIFAIIGVVVLAAAAIVAIVVLSGGDDTSPAAKARSTPVGRTAPAGPTATSAPDGASDSPTTKVTASDGGGSADAVTCAEIQGQAVFHGRIGFKDGGTKPTGVELPSADPARSCAGTTKASPPTQLTALAWNDVTLAGYVAQLTAAGWTDSTASGPHVLDKPGSKYQIVALTIKGNLVAVYGPSS